LRYSLAFLCLIPFVLLNPTHRNVLRTLPRAAWMQLALLGIVFYTIAQAAQFVGLAYLPAATLTLLLNLSPILVALSSGFLNHEPPAFTQWGGVLLTSVGAVVYFLPLDIPAGQSIGLIAALICILASAWASILGRRVNHQSGLSPIIVTTISMGIGGMLMLAIGAGTQGFGQLDLTGWLIIGWLAVVNTAFAFTIWNNTLRTLTAVESSIVNSTMLPQIAILAWLFLDESLNPRQIFGIILVGIGVLIVQLWRHPPIVPRSNVG
jgi:drug/metabolite transporter (DMT)-like permease